MVRIVSLPDLGRRLSAAVPALVLVTSGVAFAGSLASARDGLDVPDRALTGGASPLYPSAGDAPAPMRLPPVYDTYTSDPARGTARISDTDGGRWDRDGVYDRAVGPMQFIPGTWRSMGADGDGDGLRDPQDMADATSSAGVYLCSGSGDLRRSSDTYDAVLRYNHSDDYVRTVMNIANAYRNGVTVLPVGALPAARPASGSGSDTATPEGSGFAWSGGEPTPAPSSSPSATTQPSSEPSATSEPSPQPSGGSTPRPAPAAPKPALPSPRLPLPALPTVPAVPLPSPTAPAPAPSPTTLTVAQLLALPHLPALLGDPAGLVRVLDPASGDVVCILDDTVVDCPSAVG